MNQKVYYRCWKSQLIIFLAIGGLIALSSDENYAFAQIVPLIPDTTLGSESSSVTPNAGGVGVDVIEGGARRETNLFHSFEQFSVLNGRTAYFNNATNIQNIISRVTGSSESKIDGLIRTNGTANLFLINPKGIIFGPNAQLKIDGSFFASTASNVKFADSIQFSATAPQTAPMLAVSVPIGLQYGGNAGRIIGQGVSLQVQPSKTLALVGGDVSLNGGSLQALVGRIELGGLAGAGTVGLTLDSNQLGLIFPNDVARANVSLTNEAIVVVNGVSGGNVQVQGKKVILNGRSQILVINEGSKPGGKLTVVASDSVELSDSATLRNQTRGAGPGGGLTIATRKLIVRSGADVGTSSSGNGLGGELTVTASDYVELTGTSPSGTSSGLFSGTDAAGDGGDIKIATGRLFVQNGAAISTESRVVRMPDGTSKTATGDAGNIQVTAGSIELDRGKLTATSESGEGGNIRLQDLDILLLRGKSEIATDASRGSGNGGDINIDTDVLVGLEDSDITATAIEGRGGNIQINTQGVFGIEPRSERTSESDITASSDLGVDGVVEINRPEAEPSSGLVTLPAELVDVSRLIAQGCAAGGGNVARAGKFVATGRGGLPPTPTEALRSDAVLADLGTPVQSQDRASAASPNLTNSQPSPIVEAQGWVIGSKGEVVLTAQAPTVTRIPWLTPTSCNAS